MMFNVHLGEAVGLPVSPPVACLVPRSLLPLCPHCHLLLSLGPRRSSRARLDDPPGEGGGHGNSCELVDRFEGRPEQLNVSPGFGSGSPGWRQGHLVWLQVRVVRQDGRAGQAGQGGGGGGAGRQEEGGAP